MGLKHDREALVGLQLGQGASHRVDPLPALRPVGRRRPLAGDAPDLLGRITVRRQEALPRATQRDRLPPGDDLHPCRELGLGAIGRFGEQDLDRALEGILGVCGAQRVAASGAAKGRFPGVEQGERGVAHALVNPARPADAPGAPPCSRSSTLHPAPGVNVDHRALGTTVAILPRR